MARDSPGEIRVGSSAPGTTDPAALRSSLTRLEGDGFDWAEISLDMFPLIIGGRICRDWVAHLRGLLGEFSLGFSGHIGRDVDLRDRDKADLQKKVLHASIEVCGVLGLNPLVLHFEVASKDPATEKRFLEEHLEAADFAASLGVTLCIENIEVETVDPVIDFVEKASHPNLRMNFDTGHAWLASKYFGFDFLGSLRRSLPVLGHMHLSDNTGVFEELRITDRPRYDTMPAGYRMTFGRGDIHLPPYWGSIPFDEVFQILHDYSGVFVCEYKSSRFLPFNRSVQERVRTAISGSRQ